MKMNYKSIKVEHITVDTALSLQENSHRIVEEIKRSVDRMNYQSLC